MVNGELIIWFFKKNTASINDKLIVFAQKELVIAKNNSQRIRIKNSIEQLQKKLSESLQSVKLFGSYTRNTTLPGKYDPGSDIDLIVIFKTDSGIKTPEIYRRNLLEILSKAYPYSISKKDLPAVKLELNRIIFDIIPSYTTDYSYTTGNTYFIPDEGNGWRTTIPDDIKEHLESINQSYGNNIIRDTIRLCKHWNAYAGYPFHSYLLEEEIINMEHWVERNIYDKFLTTLSDIAGNIAGVREALDNIKKYKGDWSNDPNEEKELKWLQKLLPGLK